LLGIHSKRWNGWKSCWYTQHLVTLASKVAAIRNTWWRGDIIALVKTNSKLSARAQTLL
jgi:hypothetical protein